MDHTTIFKRGRETYFFKNFILILGLFELLFGIIFLSLFIVLNPIILKTIFLILGTTLLLVPLLRLVKYIFIPLPEIHFKYIGRSIVFIVTGFYLVNNHETGFWNTLAIIIIIIGFLNLASSSRRLIVDQIFILKLLKSYKNNTPPDLSIPYVYILSDAQFSNFFVRRLSGKILKNMWDNYFVQPRSYEVSAIRLKKDKLSNSFLHMDRKRLLIYFVCSESIRRMPRGFRNWLIFYAGAFIVVRSSIEDSLLQSLVALGEEERGYKLCPGPVLSILLNDNDESSFIPSKGNQLIRCTISPLKRPLEEVASQVANRLCLNAIPISNSDSKLVKKKRQLIKSIAINAMPPIADSYLNFRLAQSDVERFFSLIDCIDCLIRLSVITQLIFKAERNDLHPFISNIKRKRLTLGSWVNLLTNLINLTVEEEICDEISRFWHKKLSHNQIEFTQIVNRYNLFSLDFINGGQIAWLGWFRDLRNYTRGHGIVDETKITPIWHSLHEILLEMVAGLSKLLLSSRIYVEEIEDKRIVLKGWKREKSFIQKNSKHASNQDVFLKLPNNKIMSLFPFAIVRGVNVFVFDHSVKDKIVYFNYATGERHNITLGEMHLNEVYSPLFY